MDTRRIASTALVALAAAGCGDGLAPGSPPARSSEDVGRCAVSSEELVSTLARDAILSLADPPLVSPGHPDGSYVADDDEVVGVVLDGAPVAVPLNVLRFHEIVNLARGADALAVTYCPLTGSALVFDRAVVGGAELGVSGLLRLNNLVMFDRVEESSLFSQMGAGVPICGPAAAGGRPLPVIASFRMRWDAWRRMHPGTEVVSEKTGLVGPYDVNPYVEYERIDNPFLLVDMPVDPRRPAKELVLGVPAGGDGGLALPFGELAERPRRAVPVANGSAVVLWDAPAGAALAFSPELDGRALDLTATPEGFVDARTGSLWRVDGVAVSGPLAGRRLEPLAEAYVAFWFAWATFQPETVVWEGS